MSDKLVGEPESKDEIERVLPVGGGPCVAGGPPEMLLKPGWNWVAP